MPDTQYETTSDLTRYDNRTENKKSVRKKWIGLGVTVLLWFGLAFGSYTLAENYISDINERLNQIQQTNQKELNQLNQSIQEMQMKLDQHKQNLNELHVQLIAVENELGLVKEELSLAGTTLLSSNETKQTLNQRITELNKQLEGLRNSIKKLEEAARVY
jgi:chromosome segregation ATPase